MKKFRHTVSTVQLTIGVALLALLMAQWGALLHAVSHAPLVHGLAAAAGHVDAAAPGEAADTADAAQAPAAAGAAQAADAAGAEDHHAGSPVCQLIDHLLLAQATAHPPMPVPQAQWSTAAPPRVLWPALPCRALQAYDARGPPRA